MKQFRTIYDDVTGMLKKEISVRKNERVDLCRFDASDTLAARIEQLSVEIRLLESMMGRVMHMKSDALRVAHSKVMQACMILDGYPEE